MSSAPSWTCPMYFCRFLGQLLKWDSSVASHFDKHVSRCAAAATHHRSDMGHYGLGLLTFLKCSLPYCPNTIPLSVHSHCCKQTREAVIMPKPNVSRYLMPVRLTTARRQCWDREILARLLSHSLSAWIERVFCLSSLCLISLPGVCRRLGVTTGSCSYPSITSHNFILIIQSTTHLFPVHNLQPDHRLLDRMSPLTRWCCALVGPCRS